jgi:hypothetical protein
VRGQLQACTTAALTEHSPYKFEAPWHAFEFAFHILEVRANMVIVSMAWLTQEDRSTFTPFPEDPDFSTLTYWVRRLEPVIRAESSEEVIVVFCNRCGIEDEVTYAGTSTVIGIKDGEVSVYGLLGRGVRELLIVDTDKPPFAKLVDRPEQPVCSGDQSTSTQRPQSTEKEASQPEPERGTEPTGSPTTDSMGSATSSRTHVEAPSDVWRDIAWGEGPSKDATSEQPSASPRGSSGQSLSSLSTLTGSLPVTPISTKHPPTVPCPQASHNSGALRTPPKSPYESSIQHSTHRFRDNALSTELPSSGAYSPDEPIWLAYGWSTKVDLAQHPRINSPRTHAKSGTWATARRSSRSKAGLSGGVAPLGYRPRSQSLPFADIPTGIISIGLQV